MLGGSLGNDCVLWPAALQLLNFPSPQQQEQTSGPLVRYEYPSIPQLRLAHRRLRAPRSVVGGEGAGGQETGNGASSKVIFVRRCYMMAGLYCIKAALLVIILSKAIPPDADLTMAGFICAMVSLMVLFVLSISARLRRIYWFSFIMAGLFVSLAGLGVSLLLLERNLVRVCIALLVASAMTVICYIAGAWLPKMFLPGERTMFLLLVIYALASIFVMTMLIFTDKWIYQLAYFTLLATLLVPASVYHAQVVHSRRFQLPDYEFVICAVNVYLHFLLFFAALYFVIWAPKW
ncbi:uncharacterized protein LOC6542778 [Drosophila erecta]|uniref:Uncharacterized protein n=1 Tax=Drosophila erecta TaxID=7220 RepID=B3N7E8_DROER|nr:uncharacterized protein LOC6542778 [Drosophila erecta]EDV58299.1 uncharacterized protein Dere_GG25306 [Drosophila erecta]